MELRFDRAEHEGHRAEIDGIEEERDRDDDEDGPVITGKRQALESGGCACAKSGRHVIPSLMRRLPRGCSRSVFSVDADINRPYRRNTSSGWNGGVVPGVHATMNFRQKRRWASAWEPRNRRGRPNTSLDYARSRARAAPAMRAS